MSRMLMKMYSIWFDATDVDDEHGNDDDDESD